MKVLVSRYPLTAFFIIAVGLELLLAPIGYVTDAHSIIADAMARAGITYRTNYIVAAQLAVFEPRTHLGLFYLIVQPMSPAIAAVIVCAIIGGWNAIRELASRLKPWQRDVRPSDAAKLWLCAVAIMVVGSLAVAVMRWATAVPGTFEWQPAIDGAAVIGWFLAAMFLDGGGTGEELGWRGFAAPILQGRHRPFAAAVILGIIWSVWHMPIKEDVLLGGPIVFASYYIPFTLGLVAVTTIMLFFSNKLGGTALIGIVIHGLYNDSVLLSGGADLRVGIDPIMWNIAETMPYVLIALLIIILTRGRLGMPSSDPGRRVWTWPQTGRAR